MTLQSDSHYNFQDFDEEKLKHASTSREQYLGPWVESNAPRTSRARRELHKNNTVNIPQAKINNLQILATIHKQSQWKRKQYKTIMSKISQIQKNDMFVQNLQRRKKALQYLVQNETVNQDKFKKYKIQAGQQKQQSSQLYSPLHPSSNKGKKALNTTMYVYECKDQRKKLNKNYRNYSQCHNVSKKNHEHQQQKQMGQGSSNLQRILKMKERLRVKNSSIVRQIRQRKIQSDKFIAFKHVEEVKPMKNWKSTTLDLEKIHRHQIFQFSPRKFKSKNDLCEVNPSQITLESEFNLFGTVSNNFFSKY